LSVTFDVLAIQPWSNEGVLSTVSTFLSLFLFYVAVVKLFTAVQKVTISPCAYSCNISSPLFRKGLKANDQHKNINTF